MSRLAALTGWVVVGVALGAMAEDWPVWRGPHHDGISRETGWRKAFSAEGPKVLWRANVGAGYSGVTVADGRAYTVGNQAEKDTVYCLETATGRVIWKQSYPHPLDKHYYDGGTSSTPTVHAGRVYVVSRRGHFHCFDAATGAVIWKKEILADLGMKKPEWGFASSVLIDGDRAVINAGSLGAAFNRETGTLIWKTGTQRSGYSTPLPFRHAGQEVYLIFAAEEIAAVRADSGRKVWAHPWKTSYDVNAADPLIAGPNRILVASGYNRGCAMLDVSGSTPKVVWENKNLRSQFNPGIVIGGHVYGIDGNTEDGQLRCMELATGKAMWAFKDSGFGGVTAADGHLLLISERGELMIGPASPEGFEPVTRAQVAGGQFWTVPTLANGRFFIRNSVGQVSCLDVSGDGSRTAP